MGNDAYIFAKNSKECFYFDRKYNVLNGTCSDVYYDASKKYQESYNKLASLGKTLATKDDVIRVVCLNMVYWLEEGLDDRHRMYWNKRILDFINRHSEDEMYFILGDCDWPESHETIEKEGYTVL